MAARAQNFVCQSCGAASARWAGRCEACGAWNTLVEEGAAARPRAFAQRPAVRHRAAQGRDARSAAACLGHRRIRPRHRRRPGARLGAAPRRRSRHRQIDAADRGRRRLRARQPPRRLHFRRGSGGAGAAARRTARACRCRRRGGGGNLGRGYRRDAFARHGRLASSSSTRSRPCGRRPSTPRPARSRRCADRPANSFASPNGPAPPSSWSATSPRTARSPARASSSTWSMPCCRSRAKARSNSASCARSRTDFGPTDEIGVFEMTGTGLREVANPSELFLSERDLGSPGTAVFAGIEGTRPLLVEIQALVAPTTLGTPRRAVVGWDPSRLSMVLAVLEAHCGVRLSGHDVYLNVAGGLRIQEPAADVAAAAALVSSLAHAPLAGRRGLFRRSVALGRGAAGGANGGAAEGSAKARLRPRGRPRSGPGGGHRERTFADADRRAGQSRHRDRRARR